MCGISAALGVLRLLCFKSIIKAFGDGLSAHLDSWSLYMRGITWIDLEMKKI
jgi:hypothetical protein